MIDVRQLVKRFGDREVLGGVSFSIRPGEAVAFLGPNGAGKSTTVRILAGLLRPDRGEVRVCGLDLAEHPLDVKRRLGYVPDHAKLYETLTPDEYLSLIATLHGMDRATASERIGLLFDAFEMGKAADRPVETLSRGQRQKVLLTAALVHDPDVLLLDEPLNGLDVNSGLVLRRTIQGLLQRGRTILFCSHILEVIERLCARTIVLDGGRIVADDATAELVKRSSVGTLEDVFRRLTRPDQADAGAAAFLQSLDRP